MKCYIDGDALPNLLKPVLLRAIKRLDLKTVVVSNKKIDIGKSELIEYIVVSSGSDEADNKIVEMLEEGDLVITTDIPLADRVISKNAYAIDHRGELFTKDNIKQYLAMRNLMEQIRESGKKTKGPKPFSAKDVHNFSTSLNNFFQGLSKSFR